MFIRAVLFLVISSACCHAYTRNVVKTLRVYNGGRWGDWNPAQYCPHGQYATGYRLKIEGGQGRGDDTSMNGIELVCGTKTQSSTGHTVTSKVGPWGSWYRSFTKCDQPEFLTSFNLQVERPVGKGDDTAANFVTFRCRHMFGGNEVELRQFPGHGFWGNFGGWSTSCNGGSAICGIETKVEGRQGGDDDTALNDVMFHCCDD